MVFRRLRAARPEWDERKNRIKREKYRRDRAAAGFTPRVPAPHGTAAACSRHYRRGEPLCLTCAWSVAESFRPPPCGTRAAKEWHRRRGQCCVACRTGVGVGRPVSEPHGTEAALRRHEYHREQPCDPCREVQRRKSREKRERARARLAVSPAEAA